MLPCPPWYNSRGRRHAGKGSWHQTSWSRNTCPTVSCWKTSVSDGENCGGGRKWHQMRDVEIDSNTATVIIFRLRLRWYNHPLKQACHYQRCEYLRSLVAKFRHEHTQPRGCFRSRSFCIDWNVSAKVCKGFIICQLIRDPADALIRVPEVS